MRQVVRAVSSGQTHYEVLGLPPEATLDQIKKRFRELARKYHPDLNRDHPEYHEVFIRITTAYECLSDTSRRARYDLDLRDKQRRQSDSRSGAYGSAPFTQSRPSPPPGGAARSGSNASGARPNSTAGDFRAKREAEQRKQTIARQMEQARQAYQRGNYREAQRLCEEVLEISRNASAYDMLGDVYNRQGRYDDAIRCYTVAAQMLPNDGRIMTKLNRAVAQSRRSGPTRVGDDFLRNSAGYTPPADAQKRVGYQLAVTFFGLAIVLFMMAWPLSLRDTPMGLGFAPHWTITHLALMALDGVFAGAILAAAGWLRPPDQELLYQSVGVGRLSIPMGVLLFLFGILFYPLALILYLPVAYRQASISRSVLTLFTAAFLVVLGFTFAAPRGGTVETLLLGGNVVFPAMLVGWFIGELFRPSWVS
jgi:tetratricopeptide (TPR) repeat protein